MPRPPSQHTTGNIFGVGGFGVVRLPAAGRFFEPITEYYYGP